MNIVRTALIFVDDNAEELKKDLDETKEEEKIPEVRDDYDVPNTFENFWD